MRRDSQLRVAMVILSSSDYIRVGQRRGEGRKNYKFGEMFNNDPAVSGARPTFVTAATLVRRKNCFFRLGGCSRVPLPPSPPPPCLSSSSRPRRDDRYTRGINEISGFYNSAACCLTRHVPFIYHRLLCANVNFPLRWLLHFCIRVLPRVNYCILYCYTHVVGGENVFKFRVSRHNDNDLTLLCADCDFDIRGIFYVNHFKNNKIVISKNMR